MAEFPYFAFWVEKFSTDTNHLNDAECGLYLRLLMLMWNTPGCRVPNDNAWLAHKLGRSVQVIENTLRPLITEYCYTDGNWHYQKRLLKEYEWSRRRHYRSSVSAKARWNKEKETYASNAIPTPTPTPTPIKESTRHEDVPDGTPVDEPPKARLFREGRMLLVSMGVTERTSGAVIGKWLKDRADPDGILAAIKYAEDNSIIEPIAYVSKLLKEGKPNGGWRHRETFEERCDRLISKAREVESAAAARRTDDHH